MAKTEIAEYTPWGRIRPGQTVIVTTSQRKPKRIWHFLDQVKANKEPPSIRHLGIFIGVLNPRSRETKSRIKYPELDSYIEIQTMPDVRTQIPFSNIDSIK